MTWGKIEWFKVYAIKKKIICPNIDEKMTNTNIVDMKRDEQNR